MVPLNGLPLISRNVAQWSEAENFSIYIACGYKSEALEGFEGTLIKNHLYAETNMVWSMLMALPTIELLKGNFVYISYGDIVVARKNIELLIRSNAKFSVLVDLQWEALWSLRMENYMSDVESLKVSGSKITEIGKPAYSKSDIQGQYMGVLKIDRLLLIKLLKEYKNWVDSTSSESLKFERRNLYLTDFIQRYIDNCGEVTPVMINGGWLEVDTTEDLKRYEDSWDKNSIFTDLM